MNNLKNSSLALLFLLVAVCFLSCNQSIDNIKDYYKYINTVSNGLLKIKNIGALSFSVKYIPTDFYLYRSQKESPTLLQDSLKEEYDSSLNFILKVAPSEDADVKFDVMTETVGSLSEFKEQAFTINFELQKLIRLKVGDQELKPVLVETENVYGLTQHRLINIVFAKEDIKEAWANVKKMDLIFNDDIYGTGRHHFLFYKSDLDKIPKLTITK
ncbi:hypothetical protein [Aureispira anguillae]|uniref:Lipoprotein n=1 Tax=Aureispira anguillae TaxID=2864201 RepID=A0A915YCE8_9BACT|nr:hypothetical protein [Aureispira anguillae]BDS10486.1 hypothetical protein AsAng_0011940 [Aureispira anguillae]